MHSEEEGNPRIGYLSGFTHLAEKLRIRLEVKKSQLKRNDDQTYYSKLLNGHIVPGWGEETVLKLGNSERHEVAIGNRGRTQLKNFIKNLLFQAYPGEQIPISEIELVAEINKLLLSAEYAPLDPERNQDDAYLINYLGKRCRRVAGGKAPVTSLSEKLIEALSQEVERLMIQARLQISHSEEEKGKVTVILYEPGQVYSPWFRELRAVEEHYPGSRYYYGASLTAFATPKVAREVKAKAQGWSETQLEKYLESRQERLERWEKGVARYKYRDIYDMEGVAHDLKNRMVRGVRISPNQTKKRVELICHYLEHYPNFEIGLCREKLNFNFRIHGENVVLLESRHDQPSDKFYRVFGVRLEGQAFVHQFLELHQVLWENSLTERTDVKEWLVDQIKNM